MSGSTNGAESPMPDRERRGPRRMLLVALAFACLAAPAGWTVLSAIARAKTSPRVDEPVSLAGLPALSIDDAGIAEGDVSWRRLIFTVHLSEAVAETVTVGVTTF